MTEIFAYGTLLDREFQLELFGRALPARPARLAGWLAVFTETGYLTIVPDQDASVAGAVIRLDVAELAIADAWEEVPLYIRTAVTVRADEGIELPCWAYVRATDSRERAAPGAGARHSRADILAAIRALTREREA